MYGIQMIPFTPITEALLPASWMEEAWPAMEPALTRPNPPIEDGFRAFLYSGFSIINKEEAWRLIQTVPNWVGPWSEFTRANAYYFIATRP